MIPPVKVCGNTRIEDALLAESCGAWAIGFIFYRPSPRYCPPEQARRVVEALHPLTIKVGVFVGASAAEINQLVTYCGLDRVQLHGGEPYPLLGKLIRPAYRVLKLKTEADVAAIAAEPDDVLMLDTHDPGLHGGTGRPFNWEWAREVGTHKHVILAGGLNAGNIAEALRVARPSAVDVSSGLEARPGVKDPAKVQAFFDAIAAAQTADTASSTEAGSP